MVPFASAAIKILVHVTYHVKAGSDEKSSKSLTSGSTLQASLRTFMPPDYTGFTSGRILLMLRWMNCSPLCSRRTGVATILTGPF
jgi:hypothetical protein